VDQRPKEGARIPSTAVEELVISAPVLMLAIVKTDRTRNGAAAQAAEQAKCKGDRPRASALLAEGGCPALQ